MNTAIARNIQHSLKNYQYEGHFRHLYSLYEKNELTSAINRIVQDINHRFTIDVLDRVDKATVTANVKAMLEILNKKEQTVAIADEHRREIKEYLDLLDLTCDIDLVDMADLNRQQKITVLSQPGLRYSQAEALVKSLMLDACFSGLSLTERMGITKRILEEIKGRMLEEIVLLETKKACPDKEVFKLQFAVGEFDMVVFDPEQACCALYEVKHSTEQAPEQYRHLADEEKLSATAFRYGTIQSRTVLYRGEDAECENGIRYRNVCGYLLSLP